jgi:hypothetical protein
MVRPAANTLRRCDPDNARSAPERRCTEQQSPPVYLLVAAN